MSILGGPTSHNQSYCQYQEAAESIEKHFGRMKDVDCHPCESREPEYLLCTFLVLWIPACAGMTMFQPLGVLEQFAAGFG